jgi:hypothetical protein
MDDIKDRDSFSESNIYKPISIDSNREYLIRKSMVRYTNQLDKFRNCTAHIKYKFAILTNDVLCVINRYNETECYLIKNGGSLVSNIIDSKTDTVIPIGHELYVTIDLPSFYEKINQVPTELIRLHKIFYSTLNRAHTKQTATAEHRFKNYQSIVTKMMSEYSKNSKYLEMMESLTQSLEKSIEQEEQIIQKIAIVGVQDPKSTMTKDTERSFKISKNETDLQKIREVKIKTGKLLHEIKTRYQNFLITFDSTITDTCASLKNIEQGISRLGINLSDKKK